ncbi:hypothetical protein [Microbulbifer guangxiensis]|uniref:hypothetical protein n=1 Tax=Microbulbifer guangxiensis TaxID=2904249 RepID=UPI001F3D9BF4|nr:hypothetical protein [Microbulbifer guangxiensis]
MEKELEVQGKEATEERATGQENQPTGIRSQYNSGLWSARSDRLEETTDRDTRWQNTVMNNRQMGFTSS